MKVKVYVIDVTLPRWLRRVLIGGVVPAAVLGLGALVYASSVTGQPDFNEGDVVSAAALNAHLGALQTQVPPPKSVVLTTLSATDLADVTKFSSTGLGTGAYLGWALCNGNNGTSDLTDRFPRMTVTGGGATGGSDSNAHLHPIDHEHPPFASAAGAPHAHGAGTIAAEIDIWVAPTNRLAAKFVNAPSPWTSTHSLMGASISVDAIPTTGGVSCQGTSDAEESHTHTIATPTLSGVSGGASTTENRPRYVELVPLCKL